MSLMLLGFLFAAAALILAALTTGSAIYWTLAAVLLGMVLFGAIGVFSVRYLPHAGGFVIGMSMFVALALFFVSVICAVVRRSSK